MLHIIDTYTEIEKLFSHGSFDLAQWTRYAGGISEALPQMLTDDIASYDFERQVRPVLEHLFNHREAAEAAHASFLKAIDGLNEKCEGLPYGTLNSAVIFYMGLCNAAGRATELLGRPTILLGIEKIVELDWTDEKSMAALVFHELGHHWHFQNRYVKTELETQREKALWQLYTEGVAMYFEQLLCGDPNYYHQDRDGWLNWCEENKREIARAYLGRVRRDESIQDFFGDWCSFQGHADAGYYLGAQVVSHIRQTCGTETLLNLSLSAFEAYLAEIA